MSSGRKLIQFDCITLFLPSAKRLPALFIFMNGDDMMWTGVK